MPFAQKKQVRGFQIKTRGFQKHYTHETVLALFFVSEFLGRVNRIDKLWPTFQKQCQAVSNNHFIHIGILVLDLFFLSFFLSYFSSLLSDINLVTNIPYIQSSARSSLHHNGRKFCQTNRLIKIKIYLHPPDLFLAIPKSLVVLDYLYSRYLVKPPPNSSHPQSYSVRHRSSYDILSPDRLSNNSPPSKAINKGSIILNFHFHYIHSIPFFCTFLRTLHAHTSTNNDQTTSIYSPIQNALFLSYNFFSTAPSNKYKRESKKNHRSMSRKTKKNIQEERKKKGGKRKNRREQSKTKQNNENASTIHNPEG